MKAGKKTPEYTRRAVEKYHNKFARFTVSIPIEKRDRLNAVMRENESLNALVNELLDEELRRREAAAAGPGSIEAAPDPEEDSPDYLPFH